MSARQFVGYWRLVDEIRATPHPATRAHCWLLESLERYVADIDAG